MNTIAADVRCTLRQVQTACDTLYNLVIYLSDRQPSLYSN